MALRSISPRSSFGGTSATPLSVSYCIGFGLFALAISISPLLLGMSFDHTGGYTPGLLLFVGFSLLAASLATFALPPYSQPIDEPLAR